MSVGGRDEVYTVKYGPELAEVPLSYVLGKSLELRPYFRIYPLSHLHTDTGFPVESRPTKC